MVDESAQQAIRIYTSTIPHTTQQIYHFIKWVNRVLKYLTGRDGNPVRGEQTLDKLNLQNRALDSITYREDKIQELREALHHYGVDFSIVQAADGKGYEVWFKGDDVKRIEHAVEAVEKTIAEQMDSKDREQHIDDIIAEAKAKAAERNADAPDIPTPDRTRKKDVEL